MGAAEKLAAEQYDGTGARLDGRFDSGEDQPGSLAVAPDAVEVRRNAVVAALVGGLGAALAIAYLARAASGGGALDWVLAGVMGLLGGYWLLNLVDARTPLLVADANGVRIRLGNTWRGLPWSAIEHVEHTPRRGLLRDGLLLVSAHNEEKVLDELDASARRQAAAASRLHGAPFAVPLGLATRVTGGGADLSAALEAVSRNATHVVVVEPGAASSDEADQIDSDDSVHQVTDTDESETEDVDGGVEPRRSSLRDPRPTLAAAINKLASLSPARHRDADDLDEVDSTHDEPDLADAEADQAGAAEAEPEVVASRTPAPLREPSSARRSEVHRTFADQADDSVDGVLGDAETGAQPSGRELRRPGTFSLVEDTQAWGDRVRPISRGGEAVEPIVFDEFEAEPALDPVVGPELAAARTRLGLSVDQLAERTRIRPHVIESIEVDDFVPCGGDFYARGHLRTLARVLGLDVAPLLSSYDERYAHAEISPRRVFEAELATGMNGSIRSTRGGPNWSLLVAVVMALVLCWSIARLVMDSPPAVRETPVLNGSGGPTGGGGPTNLDPVPVELSTNGGGAKVVVRDATGEIVFNGNIAAGETKSLEATPPVRVQSSDGALTVALDGEDPRPVGEPGVGGQGTFVAR